MQQSFPFRFYQLPTQSPQTPLPPPKRGFSFYSLFTAFMEQNFAGKFSLKSRVLLIAPYSPTLHFFTDKRCNIEKSGALFRLPYRPIANTTLTLTLFASVGLTCDNFFILFQSLFYVVSSTLFIFKEHKGKLTSRKRSG